MHWWILQSSSILLAILISMTEVAFAHLDLTGPTSDHTVKSGQLLDISWDVYIDHGPGTIRILYSVDGGQNYTPIVGGIPHDGTSTRLGTYLWTVPNVSADDARIRVIYETNQGEFYNGLYSGEHDPSLTIVQVPAEELILEEGLNNYTGVRDATIYENDDTANGTGDHLLSGMTNFDSPRRSLIAFDLAEIPEGSEVLSAELLLTTSIQPSWQGEFAHSIYRMGADWGEGPADPAGNEGQGAAPATGDASWTYRNFDQDQWTTPGGDYVSMASASVTIPNGLGTVAEFQSTAMVTDIQDWLDGNAANYGWALVGDESTSQTAYRFYSSDNESAESGERPRLRIVYAPMPGGEEYWELF